MNKYLTKCVQCHLTTSVKYARNHQGKCKSCTEGTPRTVESNERRQGRIIDSGWEGYAREEGHYDTYD